MSSRIIIVDDDELLREVIGEFLTSKGYEVDVAKTGNDALGVFEPGKYCMAVIDEALRSISGLKLMKEIRAIDPDVFCLIMTAYPGMEKVLKAMEDGTSDYIIKPFQLLELLNIVKKYVPCLN